MSLYFKVNQQSYYDHLQHVRETGDLEEWLQFFLKGIIYTSEQAVKTIQKILSLLDADRKKIQAMGKAGASVLIIHDILQKTPITDGKKIVAVSGLTLPTVNSSLKYLIQTGIVNEIAGKSRNKIYKYGQYLDILSEEV